MKNEIYRHYEVKNQESKVIEKFTYKKNNLLLAMIRARNLNREIGETHFVYKVNEQLLYTSKI